MTHELDPHEPRPEFVSHLEWQIRSAMRPEPRLRLAAAVVAALVVGAAGGVASGQIQDARQRDALTLKANSEQQLLQMRYQLAKEEYEESRRRFEAGIAGRESIAAAERQLRALETEMKRLQLNLQEIHATSAPPNDSLAAPLVGQRDFVRERQMLDLLLAEQALATADRELRDVTTRAQAGLASDAARLRAEAERVLAHTQLRQLQMEAQLRQEFLSGKVHASDLALKQRHQELQLLVERAERELTLTRERLDRLRKQVEVGLAGQIEVKRAEIAVLERELELKSLVNELQLLRRGRDL